MQPIKAVGIEVIADPVAAPALAAPRVRAVALSEGPAHPQVGGLSCQERNHLVHHHLKVPLEVLRGALCSAHKNVGADAVGETGQERRMKERWRGDPGQWGVGEEGRKTKIYIHKKKRKAETQKQRERAETERERHQRTEKREMGERPGKRDGGERERDRQMKTKRANTERKREEETEAEMEQRERTRGMRSQG